MRSLAAAKGVLGPSRVKARWSPEELVCVVAQEQERRVAHGPPDVCRGRYPDRKDERRLCLSMLAMLRVRLGPRSLGDGSTENISSRRQKIE